MSSSPPAIDYVAIQNTLARYCFALDNKEFDILDNVFVEAIKAKFPYNPDGYSGREVVKAAIKKRLTPVTSQHAITTQCIEIATDGKSAKAISYFTGIHFGQGKWKGQEVTAYGQYQDDLICDTSLPPTTPGASGRWLITERYVSFFGRKGEEGVMDGE